MILSKRAIFLSLFSVTFVGSINAMLGITETGARLGSKGGAAIGSFLGFIVDVPATCVYYGGKKIFDCYNKTFSNPVSVQQIQSVGRIARMSQTFGQHPVASAVVVGVGGVVVGGAAVYYLMRRRNNGVVAVQQQANVNRNFMNQVRTMAVAPYPQTLQNQQPVENAAAAAVATVSAPQVNNAQQ